MLTIGVPGIDHKVRLQGLWAGRCLPQKLGHRLIAIVPGESIFFEPRLIEFPAALAVALRYAIEWQIWRARNPALNEPDLDVLALRAAAAYYALLADNEQAQCRSIAENTLLQAAARLCDRGLALDTLTDGELAFCAAVRGGTPADRANPILEEVAPLAAPVEFIFTNGCDSRSRFDPQSGRIAYLSRPFPTPDRFCFASSTAATISEAAYESCEQARQRLIQVAAEDGLASAFAAFVSESRQRLLELLGLDGDEIDVVLCPSGTDAELFVLQIARQILGTPLVNIVTAADETGRGVALAARGHHFASTSAYGAQLISGTAIPELADGVEVAPIALRDERGAFRRADAEIESAIETAAQSGKKVLLHVMDQSKFGNRCPNLSLLSRIGRNHAGRVQIVVDACQLRVSRGRLKWYLDQGCMVEVTGSKFFGAPPFCGAILFRKGLVARPADAGLPPELAGYSSRDEWSPHWVRIRSQLPADRKNFGLMFRWHAALEVMAGYFSVPVSIRDACLRQFENEVSGIIRGCGFLELAPAYGIDGNAEPEIDGEMAHRSILAFFVVHQGRALSPRECEVVYAALDRDIGPTLPANASEQTRRLAAQLCHVGQPVRTRHGSGAVSAVLRISAGASMFTNDLAGSDDGVSLNVSREIRRAAAVVAKIGLILRCLSG